MPQFKQQNYQQPFWAYTDPNGYKLNDRITRNAIDARAKPDRMLDYHISQGTDADTLTGKVRNFMTIAGRAMGKPKDEYGSYAPWRLLRNEMVTATGRATVLGSLIIPVKEHNKRSENPDHTEPD